MKIVIAGGTGRAGVVVAAALAGTGHEVLALGRTAPSNSSAQSVPVVAVDLLDGDGLAHALAGAEVVIDLTNTTATSYRKASTFFAAATRHLVAAERAAGVRHHVVLSIVGVDRFPIGYYRAKVDQEQVGADHCAATGIVHTIARVTQFHEFAAMTYASGRVGPFVFASPLHLRPVHLGDVAAHLLDIVEGGEGGRAPDLSGPHPEDLDAMVRAYAARQPLRRRVVTLPLPGRLGRANRERVLAPAAGPHGLIGYNDWLDEQRVYEKVDR